MSIQLKNDYLCLEVNVPGEKYRGVRFDWTGQISQITYLNKHTFCTSETLNDDFNKNQGRGLYNEFGIDLPVGYDECEIGYKFPKIGIGDLTRDSEKAYYFLDKHEVEPYKFSFIARESEVEFSCVSNSNSLYGFRLGKTVKLNKNNFFIQYTLQNTGQKKIITNEYVHNFLAINNKLVSRDYKLIFPFMNSTEEFDEFVNPGNAVIFEPDYISWCMIPEKPFYFSHLLSPYFSLGTWSLVHLKEKVGITEVVSQSIQKLCLWGTRHVVSPELFVHVQVEPGKSISWERKFTIFDINSSKYKNA